MRFTGRLHSWNEERGFGFIRPLEGGEDIFVHVSALPRQRPASEDVLTFEVTAGLDGRKKAVEVRLQQVEAAGLAADKARQHASRQSGRSHARHAAISPAGGILSGLVALAIAGGIAWHFYDTYRQAQTLSARARGELPVPARCDGRTMCSQMTSCGEAKYFLKNCPGTQMDGDGDGVPCEQQWCKSFW